MLLLLPGSWFRYFWRPGCKSKQCYHTVSMTRNLTILPTRNDSFLQGACLDKSRTCSNKWKTCQCIYTQLIIHFCLLLQSVFTYTHFDAYVIYFYECGQLIHKILTKTVIQITIWFISIGRVCGLFDKTLCTVVKFQHWAGLHIVIVPILAYTFLYSGQ